MRTWSQSLSFLFQHQAEGWGKYESQLTQTWAYSQILEMERQEALVSTTATIQRNYKEYYIF